MALSASAREDLLVAIADRQAQGCAPVTVQIGYRAGSTIQDDGLLITDAPPVVVELATEFVAKRNANRGGDPLITVSIHGGGLLIS
jgi:hypothetical protein